MNAILARLHRSSQSVGNIQNLGNQKTLLLRRHWLNRNLPFWARHLISWFGSSHPATREKDHTQLLLITTPQWRHSSPCCLLMSASRMDLLEPGTARRVRATCNSSVCATMTPLTHARQHIVPCLCRWLMEFLLELVFHKERALFWDVNLSRWLIWAQCRSYSLWQPYIF